MPDNADTLGSVAELEAESFRIDRTSTVDQVADRLRSMIWGGELAPGYRLREIPLAKSFGVSRNTVRDAIRTLIQEGLISHELHRGGVVTTLSAADITDLYSVRRLLELNAVMSSSKNQPELARVEQSVIAIEHAVDAGDWQAAVEADREFHTGIAALLQSPRIDRFFDQIGAEHRFVIGVLWIQDVSGEDTADYVAEDLAEVAAEHRDVYELIAAGKRSQARQALRAHLTKNEKRVIEILAARDGADDSEGGDS